jgi:hypothetical protein
MEIIMNSNWMDDWSSRKGIFADECHLEHRRFQNSLAHPHAAQREVLADLIRIGAGSLMWQEEGYVLAPDDADGFRSQIPIRRYADFSSYVSRELDAKGGVLSCSPVMRWLKTSGTTGSSKKVPYTQHWMSRYRVPAMKAMWATYLRYSPRMLDDPHAVLDMQTVREEPTEFIKGLPYQSISNRHPRLDDSDWNPPWMDAPWFTPDMPRAYDDKMYHRVRHLVGKPLRFISTMNPSTLVSMRDVIHARRAQLVQDIENGTLDGVRRYQPDPELAARIDAVLSDENFSFVDIWPGLELFSCWASASARLYRTRLNQILPGVRQVPFMTCGTEGVVTIPTDDNLTSQPLAINQAFYEFVPAELDLDSALDAGEHVNTLLFDQVEVGKDYHLIMSQANGLCRMATGDIFRVEGFEGLVPRLNFVRRAGIFHSFTGEKLTEAHVTEAISRFSRKNQIDLGLYMCGPKWQQLPRYVLMLETSNDFLASNDNLADQIDMSLQEVNNEYASKRESKRLDRLEVIAVTNNAITRYVDHKRTAANAAQYKYKPFCQDIQFVDEVLQLEQLQSSSGA